jgi:hypothetical protein
MTVQALVECLAENDQQHLHSMCEPQIREALLDFQESLDEEQYSLELLHDNSHSPINVRVIDFN